MQKYLVDRNLFLLAKELKFKVTDEYIYDEVGGTILIVSHLGQRNSTFLSINFFALTDETRNAKSQLVQDYCNENKIYSSYTDDFLKIQIPHVRIRNWDQHKEIIKKIVTLLGIDNISTKQTIVDDQGYPVFENQLQRLAEQSRTITKTIKQRLFNVIKVIAMVFALSFALMRSYPDTVEAFSGFIPVTILLILAWTIFFKNYDPKESKLSTNIAICIATIVLSGSGILFLVAYFHVPAEYSKSPLLIYHIFKSLLDFGPRQYFILLLVNAGFIFDTYSTHKNRKITIFNEPAYENFLAAKDLCSKFAVGIIFIGLFLWGLVVFYSPSYRVTSSLNFTMASFIFYLACALGLYFINKKFYSSKGLKASEQIIQYSLIAPIILAYAAYLGLMTLNVTLSKANASVKTAYVSHFSPTYASKDSCYYIVDNETQQNIPIYACEQNDEFIRPGTKMTYETKKAFFGGDLYFNPMSYHPGTVKELLDENKTQLRKIRRVDI